MVRAALPREVWDHLEALLQTESREYLSEWARTNIAEGQAKAKAQAVLMVLDARGLDIPDDVRAEITACSDLRRLDAWITAAVTAPSARELMSARP